MSMTDGLVNETHMVSALNDKMYDELNANLHHFMYISFPNINYKTKIKCYKAEEYTKPDIVVQVGDECRYVSLKHGAAEEVHEEKLPRFIEFLKENNIDDYTIESYLLYHFGDGTTDGTGQKRLDCFQTRYRYDERIRKMNEAFNNSKEFVKKFANRVVFQGVNELANPADIIYHGDEDYGSFMSRNQLMRHIDFRTWNFMTYVVHIGPFVIGPRARYPNKEIKNDGYRKVVTVRYPKLLQDILYISSRYKF